MVEITYIPKKPCKHGHLERYTRGRKCVECLRIRHHKYNHLNRYARRAHNKEYRQSDPEREIERNSRYQKANQPKRTAYNRKRRALKLKATPPWLNAWQIMEMSFIYQKARKQTEKTGELYDVDHIVPLRGSNRYYKHAVCGLHVPKNLQILEHDLNVWKGNRLETDILGE